MEHNLTVQVRINPADREMMLVKTNDLQNVKIEHHIKGAAYEVFSPASKDSDGSWLQTDGI